MTQLFFKYKAHFIFYLQVILLIGFMVLTMLINAGWDYTKINFVAFGIMTAYSLYAKFIGTNYSSGLELMSRLDKSGHETNEIVKLENSILEKHHELLRSNRTGSFSRALLYRNYAYRIRNEILKTDKDCRKNPKKREALKPKMEVLHKMLNLLDNRMLKEFDDYIKLPEVVELVNIKSMSKMAMKRSNIKSSTLFSLKTGSIDDDLDGGSSTVSFNKFIYAFKSQLIFLIGMPIIQIIYTGLVVDEYATTKEMWLEFMGYVLSIVMGIFSGLSIGAESIRKGYLSKIQNRISVIQEVLAIEEYVKQLDDTKSS